MPLPQDVLKKRLDRIQTITVLFVMGLLFWLLLISKNNNGYAKIEFWLSMSIFLIFLMDALFSLKRGHGWAKGGKIGKEETPIFMIHLLFSFLMAGLGLLGAFYYS